MKLIKIILAEMLGLSKPQKMFFAILMQMMLSIQGRITFRSLSRYSGLAEKTFRRWFSRPFNFTQFNVLAIKKLEPFKMCICAFDACFLEKAGKATYGLDYFWNGCSAKAQRGLEISAAAIIDVVTKTAYPIGATQTPSMKDIKHLIGTSEANRIDFYLSYIKSIAIFIKEFTKITVFDGFYTKKRFVDGMLEMGFIVVGKLRLDANLKKIYKGERKPGRGRPKKFDGKCNTKQLEGFEFVKNVDKETELHAGVFYHASLERDVKVVAVTQIGPNKTPVALIYSTDTEADAYEIYLCYTARFQIEFIFRDAQQFTGLADCQSRKKEAINFHINASLAAITATKVQEHLDRSNQQIRHVFSMVSHKAKNHNETLISRFFSIFGFDLTLIKSHPRYNEALNYGVIFE